MKNLGQLIEGNKDILGVVAYMKADKVKSQVKTRKRAVIKDEDLLMMFKDIKENFGTKAFKNSDLKELCDKWNLTSRQTPSRLRKMSERGLLERFETKPLSYKTLGV